MLAQVADTQAGCVRVTVSDGCLDRQRECFLRDRPVRVTVEIRATQRTRQCGIALDAKGMHRLDDQT